MADAGLAGLEVDHRDHDRADARARCAALAGDLGLLVTGSSDYHGSGKATGSAGRSTAAGAATSGSWRRRTGGRVA